MYTAGNRPKKTQKDDNRPERMTEIRKGRRAPMKEIPVFEKSLERTLIQEQGAEGGGILPGNQTGSA